jgi:DNA (cytosine-5)-methyltransferase 1
LENVAGLLDMGIENILSDLENEGYESQTYIIPACAANAPHRRDRLWVVANRDGERFDMRVSDWEERLIQDYKKRNVATLQSEWEKFKPKPWATYTAQDWLDFNARVSRNNDGLSRELDKPRIKALGNAIVPQVAYPILKTIHDLLCLY